jgi:hypothetical protein
MQMIEDFLSGIGAQNKELPQISSENPSILLPSLVLILFSSLQVISTLNIGTLMIKAECKKPLLKVQVEIAQRVSWKVRVLI